MNFFNTTSLTGDALRQAITSAHQQDTAVLAIFRAAGGPLSPSQVHGAGEAAGRLWPIWSVRRSITNLTDTGALVKLERQRRGPYGRPEHFWALAVAETQSAEPEPAVVTVEAA
jgi:hypothetical protein